MGRKISREEAMKVLFSKGITKESVDEVIENYLDEFEGDKSQLDLDYIKNILLGIEEKHEEIDALIEKNLKNWKIERISKVNLAILRIAVYEMKYVDDVPDKVALNEAIEICKKYSDEKSVSFVNGVLDAILKSM
ncbi:MAG: transcription antitermination factor NusB [Clostridium sp.]|nr:transcription antitermination factor NusB [Clostridium sp.]MDY3827838.1 transcription antitermination factor NusB [Clostridium sp.]